VYDKSYFVFLIDPTAVVYVLPLAVLLQLRWYFCNKRIHTSGYDTM